ncbi:integrase arm-type DNA-binding domain-containing protein [Pseudomonas putida]|uniref:tyrosine-type recombinase/integrase n=1 Tax=Pseudomonas putida group TaxID=136845 RepID=UPI002ED336DA|nr:integrase arm-type DNA-binding domain-containing protein [Pseudomonas putida]
MKSNLLTVKSVERLLRSGEKAMHSDGQGLYLKVSAMGSGSWIYRFKLNGRSRDMGLGTVDDITLVQARDSASQARKIVKGGSDPILLRQQLFNPEQEEEAPPTKAFKEVAQDYIEAHRAGWKNAKHAQQWTNTLSTYAFPIIGNKPVDEVDTDHILQILNPIWTQKPETAARVRNRLELVLDAAKARRLRTGENPALWRGHLDKLLPRRRLADRGNHAALPWQQLPSFMAALKSSADLSSIAVELTVLCALRTSEIIGSSWDEIDLKEEIWTIPAARMKAGRQHRVPLSKAALETLRRLKVGNNSELLFPGRTAGRPLSNMAMLQKIRGMDEISLKNGGPGWRNEAGEIITMHGFRSSFRDWAAETTHFSNIVPEMALAHKVSNATEAAYRRGDLLEKRKQLMEEWACYALSACKSIYST